MALEKLSPSGAPILPRFAYGQEAGGTEHIILVDATGKPVEASAAAILAKLDVALSTRALEAGGNLAAVKTNTDKLDINLSKAALGANIAQNRASANYGLDFNFAASGTAVPATTENTLLDISGFGKLHFILFLTDISSTFMQCRMTLDGVSLLGSLGFVANLAHIHGSGLIPGSLLNITNNEPGDSDYAIEINPYILGGGAFGTSAKVTVINYDSGAHNACITVWYLTSASEKFTITNPAVKDVAAARKDLANTLSLDEEDITTIYQEDWDEIAHVNVPSLCAIVHPRLSEAGKAEVTQFLDERRKV